MELPSYVDDICAAIIDHDGKESIPTAISKADRIVNEVAKEWGLPLEKDKHEEIFFGIRGSKKKKRHKGSDAEKINWLGIIIDRGLRFNYHWQYRIQRARQLLGALSSVGNSQWGISPNSWRSMYTGMIRAVALWGAEIGWRGQKAWRREFEKLQY